MAALSYGLGCVSPVKHWRPFNILGKGARWRILSGMPSNFGFCIEAIRRFVGLTAGILLALRNPDVAVSHLDFHFIQVERHIGFLGHACHFRITKQYRGLFHSAPIQELAVPG